MMRPIALAVALAAAGPIACRSSDPGPSCPACSADAVCVQLACLCKPSHAGDGLTCTATGLEPGAPWPAERGNAGHSGQSVFLGAQTGTLRWRFATDEVGTVLRSAVGSPVIGADGTIYVACRYKLYAVRPDGTPRWSYGDSFFAWATPAIGADGRLYVHGSDGTTGKLVAIDPSSSAPIVPAWSFTTTAGPSGDHPPVIGADGTIYVATDAGLFAVNRDGTERWRNDLVLTDTRSPALGGDGSIYVVSRDGVAYALRSADGSTAWSLDVGDRGSQPVVGPDGTLYLVENHGANVADRKVLAIRPDRTIRWSWPGAVTSRLAAGADGTVYVVGATDPALVADTPLYALDPAVVASGGTAPRWVYDPPRGTDFAAPSVGADGTVYVSDDNSVLLAIAGGKVKWSAFVAGIDRTPASSTPAIAADGTVYVGDGAGYLDAFGP